MQKSRSGEQCELLLIRGRHDGTDHMQAGNAFFTDPASPDDPGTLENHPTGVRSDAEVAKRTGRKPSIDGDLDAGRAHVQRGRVRIDWREDLNLCVGVPANSVATLIGLRRWANLRLLAPGRRWVRTVSWQLRAHGSLDLKHDQPLGRCRLSHQVVCGMSHRSRKSATNATRFRSPSEDPCRLGPTQPSRSMMVTLA